MRDLRIDLLTDSSIAQQAWSVGQGILVTHEVPALSRVLGNWAKNSQADYGIIVCGGNEVPAPAVLERLIDDSVDVGHAGIDGDGRGPLPGIDCVVQDWTMLRFPLISRRAAWLTDSSLLMLNRDVVRRIGTIDAGFPSLESAVCEFCYRCMQHGSIVEARPELRRLSRTADETSDQSAGTYAFVLRHYGTRWAKYVALRRALQTRRPTTHLRLLAHVRSTYPGASGSRTEVSINHRLPLRTAAAIGSVTAVIPTLGRYDYLHKALQSLQRQTVRPTEIIVVDQNELSVRRPDIYESFHDLPLKVIWQDERGQSLARNTGIAHTTTDFIFFFDDDSIAHADTIEEHLKALCDGVYDVSTGVSISPEEPAPLLPASYTGPRQATTLDTGNAMMRTALARAVNGLDRNFDRGPGTDLDFGTRLHLRGARLLHNPAAVRVHYKAETGGLRVHGSFKYNTDRALFGPFPPVTQSYYGLRFLTSSQRFERVIMQYATSKLPRVLRRNQAAARKFIYGARLALGALLLPYKVSRSYRAARELLTSGVRLASFDEPRR